MAATYSSIPVRTVPSALIGLTSLFGMGRGGPNRYNRRKTLNVLTYELDIKRVVVCLEVSGN